MKISLQSVDPSLSFACLRLVDSSIYVHIYVSSKWCLVRRGRVTGMCVCVCVRVCVLQRSTSLPSALRARSAALVSTRRAHNRLLIDREDRV